MMKAKDFTFQGKRKEQEDRLYVNIKDGVYAICDGVGSTTRGAEASDYVVQMLERDINVLKALSSSRELEKYLRLLHKDLLENYTDSVIAETYATTIAIVIIRDEVAYVGNIGDTKIYIIAGNKHWVSKDHSAVQELFDVGIITNEKEMQSHPFRNRITSSLSTTIEPEDLLINSEELFLPKDIDPLILLASDGALEEWTSGSIVNHFTCPIEKIDSQWKSFKEKATSSNDNSSAILIQ